MAFAAQKWKVRVSKRLIVSYIIDWALIFLTFGMGGLLNSLDARHHAFSLVDPSISFPHMTETVSTEVLMLVCIPAPIIIIILVCLVFIPGPTAARSTPRSLVWRRKLWEINTGLMGLGVSLAGAFFITEGLKDVFGKPRPDFLSRCDPDLKDIKAHIVGGLANYLEEAPPIVSWTICQNKSSFVSHDGFASFPSGHSSFSWAGMGYLTLFLCSKFNIAIPFLAPRPYTRSSAAHSLVQKEEDGSSELPLRNQAAAPPVSHLILAFVPIGVAAFISATRWGDYRHQGFDIIFGALLGATMSYIGFRWYHLPIRRGGGWSWGARTRSRAFGIEPGVSTYVGEEGWESSKSSKMRQDDPERADGPSLTTGGIADETETSMES